MKVLFVSRLYPNTFNERNGAVMHSQALELQKQGFEVRVVSPTPYIPGLVKRLRKNWYEYSLLQNKSEYQRVNIYHPKYLRIPFGLLDTSFSTSLIYSIKKVVDDIYKEFPFDIVHSHMAYPDNYAANYISQKYKVPLVTTIRSSDMDITSNKKSLKKSIENSLDFSDKIISPSPQLAKKLKEKYGHNSIHIGNGIYPEYLEKEVVKNANFEKKIEEFNHKRKLISISTLTESKGIQYNIEAMASLIKKFPDLIYFVIGEGKYKKNLIDLVNRLKLQEHVIFLGDLPHPEAMCYLKASNIFSMPSYRETFGLVYLESMFLEKPVILCENQAMDGAIQHKKNGIVVPPHSVSSIVENIEFLFENEKLSNKIAINGKHLVLERYTWNKIGENLVKIYMNLM